jgi:hypothetical protein
MSDTGQASPAGEGAPAKAFHPWRKCVRRLIVYKCIYLYINITNIHHIKKKAV